MENRKTPHPVRPFDIDFSPLKQMRMYRGYTQGQVSASVGIHKITYWRIENNRHPNPSIKALVAIGRALGVPYSELYTVTEPKAS